MPHHRPLHGMHVRTFTTPVLRESCKCIPLKWPVASYTPTAEPEYQPRTCPGLNIIPWQLEGYATGICPILSLPRIQHCNTLSLVRRGGMTVWTGSWTRPLPTPHPEYSRANGPRRDRPGPGEREFVIDNLLVRIHFIIEMFWWTGLAPWEFRFPVPGPASSPHTDARELSIE